MAKRSSRHKSKPSPKDSTSVARKPGRRSARAGSKKNPYEFFAVAADILVLRNQGKRLELLLIQRKCEPHQGSWALPGGFLDRDEDALTAARRELREETRLRTRKFVEFGTFSDPKRDPRGRTLSVSYYTLWSPQAGVPRGSDDAGLAEWFDVHRLPPLAFDHAQMIRKGLARYRLDRVSRRK